MVEGECQSCSGKIVLLTAWIHFSPSCLFSQVCQACQGSTYLRAVLWTWAWPRILTPTLTRWPLTPPSSDTDPLSTRTCPTTPTPTTLATDTTPCWCMEDPRHTQEWPCLHRDPLCSLPLTPVLEDKAWTSMPNNIRELCYHDNSSYYKKTVLKKKAAADNKSYFEAIFKNKKQTLLTRIWH